MRHAEKDLTAKKDPPLTPAGEARAKALAEHLAEIEVLTVHSTDTLRTRSTGAPTARAKQLQLQIYDGGKPAEMLQALKGEPGVHLVVGHSNTVPSLVEAVGGEPGPTIDEWVEFDRLVSVVIDGEKPVTTKRSRYGGKNPVLPVVQPEWAVPIVIDLASKTASEGPVGRFAPEEVEGRDGKTHTRIRFEPKPELTAAVRGPESGDPFVDGLRGGMVRVDGLGVFVLREKPGVSGDEPLAVSFHAD